MECRYLISRLCVVITFSGDRSAVCGVSDWRQERGRRVLYWRGARPVHTAHWSNGRGTSAAGSGETLHRVSWYHSTCCLQLLPPVLAHSAVVVVCTASGCKLLISRYTASSPAFLAFLHYFGRASLGGNQSDNSGYFVIIIYYWENKMPGGDDSGVGFALARCGAWEQNDGDAFWSPTSLLAR